MALQPAALEISLQSATHLENERTQLHQLWQQRLERANFEAERAARHYRLVEPENRLVARQLAQEWEQKLAAVQQLQEDYQRFLHSSPLTLSEEERAAIRQLAQDIPYLWQASTTTPAQRQEIIRQLIELIKVEVEGNSERVNVTIHWNGGEQTQGKVIRPVAKITQLSYYPQLCQRLSSLHQQGLSCQAIAEQLNDEGFRPPKRAQIFKESSVRSLVRFLGLTQPIAPKMPATPLGDNEWWLADLAQVLAMPYTTLDRWLRNGLVRARQLPEPPYRRIIWADEEEIERLRQYRQRSISEESRQRWLKRRQSSSPESP